MLLIYGAVTGALRDLFDSGALEIASAFVLATALGRVPDLVGIHPQRQANPLADLIPFGVVASILLALYGIGASIYVPRLLETYAARYGVIGLVFAIISALFAVMIVIVGSAALGREVHDELGRIRRGERPSEDEVRNNGMPDRRGADALGRRARVGRAQSVSSAAARPQVMTGAKLACLTSAARGVLRRQPSLREPPV